jgi:tRNA G18 (ribose-2'-O)-methylase SpoU
MTSDLPDFATISDPDDPRIAPFRDVRERDLVGREGLFLAEGEVVVRMLLRSTRHQPLALLVAERRLGSLADAIRNAPEPVQVFAAAQSVMDRIVGFPIHRGILALGRPRSTPSAEGLIAAAEEDALFVVLSGLANHDNVGGVFRNAAAFGANAVILDAECCDPLYRKAIRVSVGASLVVPFARLTAGADLLAPLVAAGFEPIALSPGGRSPLAEALRSPRTALVFGREGDGLPQSVTGRCRTVRIEMAPGLDSLNVATASGIALHHFAFRAALTDHESA